MSACAEGWSAPGACDMSANGLTLGSISFSARSCCSTTMQPA